MRRTLQAQRECCLGHVVNKESFCGDKYKRSRRREECQEVAGSMLGTYKACIIFMSEVVVWV